LNADAFTQVIREFNALLAYSGQIGQ